ncbi:hypothetical protein [Exiguobacterium sp. KJ 601]|uniref:hypothetical protein n=1 Tax=Exiguobacterium sp. KJ 601 TaxID=2782569 RepID=UPI0022B06D12|nr:hypothetical protein [Exiguobacterium sp. KJ 601]
MVIYKSLDYYFKIGYLPLLKNYKIETIRFDAGCFLALDVRLPLYRVREMKAQSLKSTWNEVNQYVNSAFEIMFYHYNEDVDSGDERLLVDIDREILYEIDSQLDIYRPSTCYPIYIITVGGGANERVVYIGKTSSQNHRFSGGHAAALKLHDPKYDGIEKHIYFATVTLLGENEYMPLEFIYPYTIAEKLLENVEAGLIYNLKPELNKVHFHKNNARFQMLLNIENHSVDSDILHNEQIAINPEKYFTFSSPSD